MKIYTKTGDQGETGLLGGVRVSKTHAAITATGSIDEVNSLIGVVRSHPIESEIGDLLMQVQHDLFDLGSRVAACLGDSNRVPDFPQERAVELESWIDQYQGMLAPLTQFILPSGSTAGSLLHLARTVCRRAERDLVGLIEALVEAEKESFSMHHEQVYLNRLSDLLFVLARRTNQHDQSPETVWSVGRKG